MSFQALAESANRLRAVLNTSTGRPLLADVSLDKPSDSQGEGAFIKSVLWCYVLWFEAFQPAGRYLMTIVRNTSPDEQRVANRAFSDVENLRTFYAHNLDRSSRHDQYKLTQAKAWLSENGGTKSEWDRCTCQLCSDLAAALDILYNHWNLITASPEDKSTAIEGLINALEREWKPHLFDDMITEIATSLGLPNFNAVKYRETRLEDWRGVTKLFQDRKSAESAIRRVIYQELANKFGPPSI